MVVASFQEAQDYLKFLPVLQNLPKRPFLLLYDPEADVLYVDFHSPPKSAAKNSTRDKPMTHPLAPKLANYR
jgi:hypothetical protein